MNSIYASFISGSIELAVVYPLDYLKTIRQNNKNLSSKDYIRYMRTPYRGAGVKMIGFVPMRVGFWSGMDYFNKNGYGAIKSGIYTAGLQTLIDYPIEQIKTQRVLNNVNMRNAFSDVKIVPSFGVHLIRNMIFMGVLNSVIESDKDSMYVGALGGLAGSLITQPLDTLKTWYQSGKKSYPVEWRIKDYMRGWQHRGLISLLSMNIGWLVFSRFLAKENMD